LLCSIDILRKPFLGSILRRHLCLHIVRAHLYVCPLLYLIDRKKMLCNREMLFFFYLCIVVRCRGGFLCPPSYDSTYMRGGI
jgi:hypothetical protein